MHSRVDMVAESENFYGLNPTPSIMEIPERNFFDGGWKSDDQCRDTDSQSVWDEASRSPVTAPAAAPDFDPYGSSWLDRTDGDVFKFPDTKPLPLPSHSNSLHPVSWKSKHPAQWQADDVTLWICSLMGSDVSFLNATINVQGFLNLSGAQLVAMSCKEMMERDPQNGSYVYTALQNLMSQMAMSYGSTTTAYSHPCYTQLDSVNPGVQAGRNPEGQEGRQAEFRYPGTGAMDQDTKEFVTQKLNSLNLNLISFDVDDDFASIRSFADPNGDPLKLRNLSLRALTMGITESQQKRSQMPAMTIQVPPAVPAPIVAPPLPSPSSDGSQSPTYTANGDLTLETTEAMRNAWSQHPINSVEVKGNHLWEFIRDLLFDSRYNPSLVKWEDRKEGVFKFVRSDQVAKLWGRKKNNPAMTYEKLSRAMRYYYKRKILERIDGRRLVYKFGPVATGWQA